MSYYQGDFYRGDFYQGDPGFFSFLGRKVLPSVAGLLPGVGGIAGKVLSRLPVPARRVIATGTRAIIKHPVLSAAGAAGVVGAIAAPATMGPGGGAMTMPGGAGVLEPGRLPMLAGAPGMRGFHMSKPRRINPASGIPHLVRNRRMRVTNVRALRRAIRRAHGFGRIARKVMRFTSPRPPRGRAVFKTRRRKK